MGRPKSKPGTRGGGDSDTQGAEGGLALVAAEGDRLIEELPFFNSAGRGVGAPQFGQHFAFRLLTHVGGHSG